MSTDVEVDFLGEVAMEEVLLCLRNVAGIRHSNVMYGIEVLT